jgi:uncharacterized protein (DUF1697 family)
MALVVLLRGVNVGGHRTFRPTELAYKLRRFGVVNIGAAGTFVVHRPGRRTEFRAALLRHVPFATTTVVCDGRDLLRLDDADPFGPEPANALVVRFVSFPTKRIRTRTTLPIMLPAPEDWLVRVVAVTDKLVFGEYRRHMRTIGYLGQLDRLFGVPVTTRNWNTIKSVLRVLHDQPTSKASGVKARGRTSRQSGLTSGEAP